MSRFVVQCIEQAMTPYEIRKKKMVSNKGLAMWTRGQVPGAITIELPANAIRHTHDTVDGRAVFRHDEDAQDLPVGERFKWHVAAAGQRNPAAASLCAAL